MRIPRWSVRVALRRGDDPARRDIETLIECLRYAGLITVHDVPTADATLCFDLPPPYSLGYRLSRDWAQKNAERMRSFGFNAEAVLETREQQCE
jgi:hypothetical protein